jgi:hypothetical protein
MSVIIKVYTNHSLTIEDYNQGIELLEEILKIRVLDTEVANQEVTTNESQVNYYTRRPYFEQRFKEGWGIWIQSNYKLCTRFVVYRHAIEFDISGELNLKTHIWRKLVTRQYNYFPNSSMSGFEQTLAEWNNTRAWISKISRQLGGDTLIYLNDGSHGHIIGEEMIWENQEFPAVLEALKKLREPVNYADLENNRGDFGDEHWFIEKI